MTSGSSWAYSESTPCNVFRNDGFSEKESVVGGNLDVIPIASSGFGGSVGNRDRILLPGGVSLANTYSRSYVSYQNGKRGEAWLTM
jgi:hypothetical protein